MSRTTKRDKEVGARIMHLRTKKNYSREYVSERAGITSKFLYEVEIKGKSFSTRTLLGLATALDVSADYILLGKGNIKYDKKMANIIDLFDPQALEIVKKLLETAHELVAFEEEKRLELYKAEAEAAAEAEAEAEAAAEAEAEVEAAAAAESDTDNNTDTEDIDIDVME